MIQVHVLGEDPFVSIELSTEDDADARRLRDVFNRLAGGDALSAEVSSLLQCESHAVRTFTFRVVETEQQFRSLVQLGAERELTGEFATTRADFKSLHGMCEAILEGRAGYHFLAFGNPEGQSRITLV